MKQKLIPRIALGLVIAVNTLTVQAETLVVQGNKQLLPQQYTNFDFSVDWGGTRDDSATDPFYTEIRLLGGSL